VTTIAYRAGVLAGDTLITEGDTKLPEHGRKVFRLRDGRLFGSSGNAEDGMILLDSVRKGEPTPLFKGGTVKALLVETDGTLKCYEGRRWTRVAGVEYAALGNGAHYALGAMAAGATAVQAVRAGMKHDTHSGGRVQYLNLEKRKRRGKSSR
jgi:ATP-dependent protease HslVU (ClpYQ) peptidase subunit